MYILLLTSSLYQQQNYVRKLQEATHSGPWGASFAWAPPTWTTAVLSSWWRSEAWTISSGHLGVPLLPKVIITLTIREIKGTGSWDWNWRKVTPALRLGKLCQKKRKKTWPLICMGQEDLEVKKSEYQYNSQFYFEGWPLPIFSGRIKGSVSWDF